MFVSLVNILIAMFHVQSSDSSIEVKPGSKNLKMLPKIDPTGKTHDQSN